MVFLTKHIPSTANIAVPKNMGRLSTGAKAGRELVGGRSCRIYWKTITRPRCEETKARRKWLKIR